MIFFDEYMNIMPDGNIRARVLVVEDNFSLGNLVAHALGKIGHSCALESSLSGALALLGVEHFDLILLDNDLPDGRGVDSLPEIARGQSALIVLMTGAPSAGLKERALDRGFFEFIAKPLSMERIVALAETAARPLSVRAMPQTEACP